MRIPNFSKSIKYPSDIPNEDKALTATAGLLEKVHVWNEEGCMHTLIYPQ